MSVIKKGGTQFGQVHLPGQAFHDGVLPFTRFAFVHPHVVCFLLHDQVVQEGRNFQVFIQLSPQVKRLRALRQYFHQQNGPFEGKPFIVVGGVARVEYVRVRLKLPRNYL